MKKIAKWLRLVVAQCLLFALGIVVIELVFGNWLVEEGLGILGIPRDRQITSTDSQGNTVVASWDRLGFRSGGVTPPEIDVVVMGGSTTAERLVADGQTWVDELEAALKDRFDLAIVNAGVDGQTVQGHIQNVKQWFGRIPELKPKVVLFLAGTNDLNVSTYQTKNCASCWQDHPNPPSATAVADAAVAAIKKPGDALRFADAMLGIVTPVVEATAKPEAEKPDAETPAWWRQLFAKSFYDITQPGFFDGYHSWALECHTVICTLRNNSVLFKSVSRARGYFRAQEANLHHNSAQAPLATNPFDAEPTIAQKSDLFKFMALRGFFQVETLVTIAEKMAATPVIVPQSAASFYVDDDGQVKGIRSTSGCGDHQCNGRDFYLLYQAQTRGMLAACKFYGVTCIDAFNELRFDPHKDFYDVVHTTPAGSQKLGQFIAQRMIARESEWRR